MCALRRIITRQEAGTHRGCSGATALSLRSSTFRFHPPPIAAHVFVHSDGLRRSPQTFSDRGTPLTVKINSTHPVSFLNVIYIEYSFFFFAVELSLTERKVRVDELMIF